MFRIPQPYEVYKHFKGNLYQILNIAQHSETGQKLVIYQALYGEYKIYARPLESFVELLDKSKYPEAGQEYRFELQSSVSVQAAESVQTAETVQTTESGQAADAMQTTAPVQNVQLTEPQTDCEAEELNIDPMVLKFLEADTYEEKLQILTGLQHRITDDMITTMAISCDIEVAGSSPEERLLSLKNCLLTLERFECNRLR
ncbi:MAG: DUF1653 domain-containing protein [Lachnospiraceae bacterium]|nr:DUF1653 domain-containing protein [Lachnospiraceae bacterium]